MDVSFLRSSAGALLVVAGCGYEATPWVVELETTLLADGAVATETVEGFADPDASTFADGLLLYSRWSVVRSGVWMAELCLDLNRAALPAELSTSQEPIIMSRWGEELIVALRHRDREGKLAYKQLPASSQVTFSQIRTHDLRELTAGSFVIELGEEGIYERLRGTW